jgi:hypothetical protein
LQNEVISQKIYKNTQNENSMNNLYYIILIGMYISNLRDARGERVAYLDSAGA